QPCCGPSVSARGPRRSRTAVKIATVTSRTRVSRDTEGTMTQQWELLAGLGALAALFYLCAPLMIRFQQRMAAHPDYIEITADALSRSTAQFLMTRTEALYELGFDEPTIVQVPKAVPNVNSYFVMLINRQTGDKAIVTVIIGGTGAAQLKTSFVEFSTR